LVQALGDQLLAGTALADHQDRPVEGGGTARPLDRVEKGEALPDELIHPLHGPTVGGKSHLLARYFGRFANEKHHFSDVCANSEMLARPLN